MKKLLSVLLLLFCFTSSYAQKSADAYYEQACQYLDQDKFTEAAAAYRKAAEMGHTFAMELLGDLYRYGVGVEEDLEEACRWYKLAAEEGNDEAMYKVGYMHWLGIGVEEDNYEAFKWFSKAAECGNEDGIMLLATCYKFGYGTDRNLDEAIRLYTKVANNGNIEAMQSLAEIYSSPSEAFEAEGDSTAWLAYDEPAYPEEAFKWALKAAEAGDYSSMLNVGSYYEQGIGVKQSYDNAEKWYMDVAEEDIVNGHLKLAELYANCGKYAKAEGWYMKAMELDESLAKYNLAKLYALQGRNDEAIRLFKELADDKDDPHYPAALDLAELYYKIGNTDDAFKYYAACGEFDKIVNIYDEEGRLSEAKEYLEEMYEHGAISGNNLAEYYIRIGKYDAARDLFLKLANEGDTEAMANLGYYYSGNDGFPKDLNEAKRWLNKATDAGSELAEYLLNVLQEEHQDENTQASLLLKANEGDVKAMMKLSESLLNSKSEAEKAEGFKWLEKAADTGDEYACLVLAEKYYIGEGYVKKDLNKCISIVEKLATKSNEEAQFILLHLYVERNKGNDWKKGKKLAAELMANNMDNVDVLADIVTILLEEPEFSKSLEKEIYRALPLIEKECNGYNCFFIADAFNTIGKMEEAFKWYKLSVDRGGSMSVEQLGHCYFYGRGTEKDYAKAAELYKSAYHRPYEYALCLYHGYGTEANRYKAIELLKQLAVDEDEKAQEMLKELGIFY